VVNVPLAAGDRVTDGPPAAGYRAVDVLLILDGATDPAPSTLDQAHTPALDRLVTEGETEWLELLDPGVPVGSETAIASLLGWRPNGPVDRALVEAAARGLEPAAGELVWRVDLHGGHRLLLFAVPPLPEIEARVPVRVWPDGSRPPRMLDHATVVIGAAGAATGLAALMGARAAVPPGATGKPGSDLAGKRRAALEAIREGAERVVVHVGGADEAAHARDRAAKVAVLEAADRELTGPLAEAVQAIEGALRVCADHGCDPATGEHLGGPVPCVCWSAARRATRMAA
jgi:2,3-bisphosphoglycerate-independent phosphoglycerate mutase